MVYHKVGVVEFGVFATVEKLWWLEKLYDYGNGIAQYSQEQKQWFMSKFGIKHTHFFSLKVD